MIPAAVSPKKLRFRCRYEVEGSLNNCTMIFGTQREMGSPLNRPLFLRKKIDFFRGLPVGCGLQATCELPVVYLCGLPVGYLWWPEQSTGPDTNPTATAIPRFCLLGIRIRVRGQRSPPKVLRLNSLIVNFLLTHHVPILPLDHHRQYSNHPSNCKLNQFYALIESHK